MKPVYHRRAYCLTLVTKKTINIDTLSLLDLMECSIRMKYNYITMKNKIFLLPVFLVMMIQGLHAQTMYELTYRSPNNPGLPAITAFLVRFDNGDGYVRVKYFDSSLNSDVVLNMETLEEPLRKGSQAMEPNIFVLKSLNPTAVMPGKQISFIPDSYLFRRDSLSGYFEPWKLGNRTSDDQMVSFDFLAPPLLLETGTLTKKYLGGYFKTNEPVYENFTKSKSRGSAPLGANITLHLLIVSDIGDKTIGIGCSKDEQKLIDIYTRIAEKLNITSLDTVFISGDRYSKENVDNALNALKPGKDDIVIFHYTGHGFNNRNPKDSFPNMFLRNDKANWTYADLPKFSLNMEDTYNFIVKKGARLNLVFSDCCNTLFPKLEPLEVGRIARPTRGFMDFNTDKCKAFFIDQRLSVLATAAKFDQKAKGTDGDGSFFTYAYVETLKDLLSPAFNTLPELSWEALLKRTENRTAFHLKNRCVSCIMNPVYKVDRATTGAGK